MRISYHLSKIQLLEFRHVEAGELLSKFVNFNFVREAQGEARSGYDLDRRLEVVNRIFGPRKAKASIEDSRYLFKLSLQHSASGKLEAYSFLSKATVKMANFFKFEMCSLESAPVERALRVQDKRLQGLLRRARNTRGKEEAGIRSLRLELHNLKKKQKQKKAVVTQSSPASTMKRTTATACMLTDTLTTKPTTRPATSSRGCKQSTNTSMNTRNDGRP